MFAVGLSQLYGYEKRMLRPEEECRLLQEIWITPF
jgi:hypothetical protein